MKRSLSRNQSAKLLEAEAKDLKLPNLPEGLEASLSGGKTLTIEGTNVIRVPFGIRAPRKKRPEQPERLPTLILTFQSESNPTPPPQAA
mgnify:CR=1 FL=1